MKKLLLVSFIFASLAYFLPVLAQEKVEINFFYGPTCPHCAAEQEFLNSLEEQYPAVTINRYDVTDTENLQLLVKFCQESGAEQYFGLVPLTFVGQEFFVGFDGSEGVGREIERIIQGQAGEGENEIVLPLIGKINLENYSLPVLAVILGFLDGFNVCSLGALVLILGMVLVLRSRKKIILFGGLFILTTSLVYGLLIFLWYKAFSFFVPYLKAMEILIGLLGIGGGIFFFKRFLKFKKQGPACQTEEEGSLTAKLISKVQNSFKRPGSAVALAGTIFLFAAIITIVEFPCSAVVPVAFAGILAKAQFSTLLYLLYIAIFVLFYMLDEVVVFLIAASKMTVWLASGKFVTWINFAEALILFALGFYYLF